MFSKGFFPRPSKGVIVREWVKNILSLVLQNFSPNLKLTKLNPLPDHKILRLPRLKAFADDKLNVTQNIKVGFHRIENIVGKEENAGFFLVTSIFFFSHIFFERLFPSVFQKSSLCGQGLSKWF